MNELIKDYSERLNFGYLDLLTPVNIHIKKHLIIKKLREKYNSYEIAYAFGYRNNQSVYHAIREATHHINSDRSVRKLWEQLQ